VNYYGETNGPEHQLFRRIAPIVEALYRAIYRATGKPVQPPALSAGMPEWCHNIADRLVLTVLKGFVAAAPQEKLDARNYGRIVGTLLRGIIFFCKDVPAGLKREGLLDLDSEKNKKIETMLDIPAIIAFASEKFKRPISNKDELIEAATAELGKKAERESEAFLSIGRYLLNRPTAEQHEFLCGIPEGFILFLNNDGGYAGQRPRTELYLLLLTFWPEIVEMQKAEPPKTCKFLLDWLEKQEGKQLVDDEKQFYGLCGEVGLVMAAPGHPRKSPPA
jgi:hypothetical protein